MNSTAEEYNMIFREKMYFNTVLISILFFLGVTGNTVTLYFYAFRMPHTADRYFIPFLAAVDLAACVVGCAFPILGNFYGLVFVWEDLCKWMYFFNCCATSLSVFILFLITIFRYLKVCRPNRKQMTMKKRRICLLCSGLFSTIVSFPVLYFMGRVKGSVNLINIDVNVTLCGVKTELIGIYSNVYFFFQLMLSFIIMVCTVALYIPIGLTIYKTFNDIQNSKRISKLHGPTNTVNSDDEQPHSTSKPKDGINSDYRVQNVLDTPQYKGNNSRRRRVRHNFTSMFITIVVFYVISYLLTHILVIVASKDPFHFWYRLHDVSLNVLMILRRAYIVNHVVNPFIYGYFDLHFRKEFIKFAFNRREQ